MSQIHTILAAVVDISRLSLYISLLERHRFPQRTIQSIALSSEFIIAVCYNKVIASGKLAQTGNSGISFNCLRSDEAIQADSLVMIIWKTVITMKQYYCIL